MTELPPYVDDSGLDALIGRGLNEDVGAGDVTTEATIPSQIHAEAVFVAKAGGVLAGRFVAERIFATVDGSIEHTWACADGASVPRGSRIGTVRGPARSLLTAERLVLNIMQRMSGIATATRRYVNAVASHPARILDTRKTAPGLRMLDKWAVLLGGGENHRLGLYDMILIKDNHIAAAGGIKPALEAAARYARANDLEIEIETRTLDEVRQVLDVGLADRILLDNMVDLRPEGRVDTSRLRDAVDLIDGRVPTEASGNVTIDTVEAIARTGVTYISSGALTHSVVALDISLKMHLDPDG